MLIFIYKFPLLRVEAFQQEQQYNKLARKSYYFTDRFLFRFLIDLNSICVCVYCEVETGVVKRLNE